MAQMNLLKAGYKGKLGEMYGTEKRQKYVISAVPFSHAPHNLKQKNSFSAFSSAQKLNGAITKNFFTYTGLKVGNRNRMNVVAEHFKKLIYEHAYLPSRITEVVGETTTFNLIDFEFDENASNVKITCENRNESVNGKTDKCFIAICDYNDVVLKTIVKEIDTQQKTFISDIDTLTKPYIVMFKSSWNGKQWVMKSGTCNKVESVVINGILYINRVPKIKNVVVRDGVLSFQCDTTTFKDGILKLY